MPFIPLTDTVKVTLHAQHPSGIRQTVLGYRYSGSTPGLAELVNLATECYNIANAMSTFSGCNGHWYLIEAREMSTEFGAVGQYAFTLNGPTTLSALPANVAYCLTKRSGIPSRSTRGRLYLFDLPEDMFFGDDFNIGYGGAVTAVKQEVLLNRVSNRFFPSILSNKLGTSTRFFTMTDDGVVDTQRRRSKGRGA